MMAYNLFVFVVEIHGSLSRKKPGWMVRWISYHGNSFENFLPMKNYSKELSFCQKL